MRLRPQLWQPLELPLVYQGRKLQTWVHQPDAYGRYGQGHQGNDQAGNKWSNTKLVVESAPAGTNINEQIAKLTQDIAKLHGIVGTQEVVAAKQQQRGRLRAERDAGRPRSQVVRDEETQVNQSQRKHDAALQNLEQKKEALAKLTAEVNQVEDKLNKAKEELNLATMALQEELRKPVGTDEEMPGHTHLDIDEACSTMLLWAKRATNSSRTSASSGRNSAHKNDSTKRKHDKKQNDFNGRSRHPPVLVESLRSDPRGQRGRSRHPSTPPSGAKQMEMAAVPGSRRQAPACASTGQRGPGSNVQPGGENGSRSRSRSPAEKEDVESHAAAAGAEVVCEFVEWYASKPTAGEASIAEWEEKNPTKKYRQSK